MHRQLSIPEWHQYTLEDDAPPMRIRLQGSSMFPLIRSGRDYVTVVPPGGKFVPGEIVLLADPERKRYVMHRVWEVRDDRLLTWGDNCPGPDGWFPLSSVWGKAALIERGSRQIRPDPEKGMRWAAFWHRAGKAYRLLRRCGAGILRRIRNIKA